MGGVVLDLWSLVLFMFDVVEVRIRRQVPGEC